MDLSQLHTELLTSWDFEKNSNFNIHNVKAKDKVWWICEKWHSYEATIDFRNRWGWCSFCAGKKILLWYNDLWTTNPELLEEWDFDKNDKLWYNPYKIWRWSAKKVRRKCKTCGYEWNTYVYTRSKWIWCIMCWFKSGREKQKQKKIEQLGTLEERYPELAKERNYERNWDLKPSWFSTGSNEVVWWKCKNWHERRASINQRTRGTKCKKCLWFAKKTDEEFKEEMKNKSPNIIILNKYETARTRLKCKCKICWHEWEAIANHIQQGQWCPQCARIQQSERQAMTQEEFESRMFQVNPNIQILWKYKTSHERVKVKCKKCNHEWNPKAWDIIQWNWCPNCYHSATSYMEQFIFYAFSLAIGENAIKSRDKKTVWKELDIYIPKFNFAIEPWAWFWHKNKLKDDLKKREICLEKWINLIIIYDWCKDSKYYSFLKENNIIYFKKDLWNNKERDSLKWLVIDLFKIVGINEIFNENQWSLISDKAYVASRRDNTEEFIDKVKTVNNKIDVIWEYLWYHSKTKVRCKKCWYEWEMSPTHIMDGHWCPKCIGRLKTTKEFSEQLARKNPDIKVLWEYMGSKTKIEIQCLICWYVRKSTPWNLLYWFWCPECSKKRVAKFHSKTVLQYSSDWKFINKYKGIAEAERQTWINSSHICSVCKWKWKQAWWYIRKYEE